MNWNLHNAEFEYESAINDSQFPWAGHKDFAYDLVSNLKPAVIVELGTYRATSFYSFCQAAKDKKTNTKIFAVDTWKGDEHAGYYGDDIFQEVQDTAKTFYGDVAYSLVRKDFNEAVAEFEDNSIDILHIDGLHTYEAVKNDFETWQQKVKNDGIVLFHDIAVKKDGFGVHTLWEELKKEYSTVEFDHSNGLGVLSKNPATLENLKGWEELLRGHYAVCFELRKSIGALREENRAAEISFAKELQIVMDQQHKGILSVVKNIFKK